MARMRIWTEAFRPFVMGGDVNAPVSTEVAVGEAVDIGRGMKAYVVSSPVSGQIYIVEATTGAFVGSSITEVRDDVATADAEVMKQQLAAAAERVKKAVALEPDEFWRLLGKVGVR